MTEEEVTVTTIGAARLAFREVAANAKGGPSFFRPEIVIDAALALIETDAKACGDVEEVSIRFGVVCVRKGFSGNSPAYVA